VYGYPPAAAADVAVRTLRAMTPSSLQRALLVAFDDATAHVLRAALAG
jgi:O-acetyl-ADP-ribose deacetylase (regulator of RNase III)